MSVAAILDTPPCVEFRIESLAAGQYGQDLDRRLRHASKVLRGLAEDWGPQVAAAIASIKTECLVADWDGDQASPVSLVTLNIVEQVSQALYSQVPRSTPAPEVMPEVDGEISLNWAREPDRIFSVSIGSHSKLNYAGRLGEGVEPHDVARFDSQDPASIAEVASHIASLYR